MRFILLLGLFLLGADAGDTKLISKLDNFNDQGFDKVKAFEGQIETFNASITLSIFNESLKKERRFLKCWMDYKSVGIMVNWTDLILPIDIAPNSTTQFPVTLLAKRLGGSNLICSIITESSSTTLYMGKIAQFIVSRKITTPEIIFRVVVSVVIILLTFVMGCGLDLNIIFNYFKKPISPLIGFCSQFIFMPLISGGLAKLTGIGDAFGLGLLVIGCSPGGGASNIWTVLFEGDLNLSMTMTFISSCAALFMMPLWLFLLGRLFIDPQNVRIPYGNIALNLLQVLIPALFGIAFRWRWEDKAKLLMRRVKLMGFLFLIFIFTYGTYANLYIYKLLGDYIYLLPIGAMLPWLGFFFGYVLALITRRNKAQAIAIALETGFQNIGIALLILKFSMPQPDGDLGSTMPIVVAMFTPLPLYFAFAAIMIKKKCCGPPKTERKVEAKITIEEQKDVLLQDSLDKEKV